MHLATIEHVDEAGEPDGREWTEVHVLRPFDHFEGFGGSSRPLVAGKDGSLVTRTTNVAGMTRDYETYLHSLEMWDELVRLMNDPAWRVTFHRNAELVPA